MRKIGLISVCLVILVSGCRAPRGKEVQPQLTGFPGVSVPSVCTTAEQKVDYLLGHYWDAFFKCNGRTDSLSVLGVRKGDFEQALSNYIFLAQNADPAAAAKSVSAFFGKIVEKHAEDTSKGVFRTVTEAVMSYLYDPNSPMRDEDLYLPFARAMSESQYTPEDMRQAYEYEARMCAINPKGQPAADFKFRTLKGKTVSLYSIDAEYTVLFFSNPGCKACKEIMEQLKGLPFLDGAIASGLVAVANVYIDQDLGEWRKYAPIYPENWYNGYDFTGLIREDLLYSVRAIPSLYLLDREKRVLMKDAPTERVTDFLGKICGPRNQ